MTKRFIVESVMIDCLCEDEPRIAKVITDTKETYSYEELYEVAELLNEKQATINELQDLCGKSDYENAKLRLKNKELQEEIKLLKPVNIGQYEQIVQLQEENEQLRQVLSENEKLLQKDLDMLTELRRENEQLRENLHNCRHNKNIISEKLKLWQDAHKEYNIYNIKDFEELMKSIK